MSYSVWTDALHDTPVTTPICGKVPHGMMGWTVYSTGFLTVINKRTTVRTIVYHYGLTGPCRVLFHMMSPQDRWRSSGVEPLRQPH